MEALTAEIDVSRALAKKPVESTSTALEPIGATKLLAACSSIKARAYLPYSLACRFQTLPLRVYPDSSGETVLSVLSAKRLNSVEIQELRFFTGCSIVAEESNTAATLRAIALAYGDARQPNEAGDPKAQIDHILRSAFARSVSDIHFEPVGAEYRVRFRIDGVLVEQPTLVCSHEIGLQLVRHVAVRCRLDITEQRAPQEGGFSHNFELGELRIRVSIIPQLHGLKAAFRLFDCPSTNSVSDPQEGRCRLARLGLTDFQQRLLWSYTAAGTGSIILSGPTGSGKSTLLYSLLQTLNDGERNIVSIEDPVELPIPGINQVEVNQRAKNGYLPYLAAVMRQDPDVLMIGEIRESETAQTVLTAGVTGHVVLSTIHAGNCLEIILRFREMGVSGELLAMSLRLLGSQRLLARNCSSCASAELPSTELKRLFQLDGTARVNVALGCEHCDSRGVNGRVAAYEFLPITDVMRGYLLKNFSESSSASNPFMELRKTAADSGYRPLGYHIRELLLGGAISPAAALQAVGIAPDLAGYRIRG